MNGNGKSILSNPGIILALAMVVESALVFIWWPVDKGLFGVANVGWLMLVIYIVWTIQAFVYIGWVEGMEAKSSAEAVETQASRQS